jgi:16S rRNA (cytosine1402-N4)-methyltransferase
MTQDKHEHIPVLLHEAVEQLALKADGIYIDATFGRGGHTRAILQHLGSNAKLIVIDQDPSAIAHAKKMQSDFEQVIIFQKNYSEIYNICQQLDLIGKIDGILIDCGVSSPQLDNAERGFSFARSGPLDMRMNTDQGITAGEWLSKVKEKDLADTLYKFADERYSRPIAKAIIDARTENKFNNTAELAAIIKTAHPRWPKDIHPATKSFQAIRIFVNQELKSLALALEDSLKVLKPGGRMCVISFHSLEDRMVKQFVNKYSQVAPELADLPLKSTEHNNIKLKKIAKAIKPSAEEITHNPRARSSRLRVMEKIF